MAGETWGFQSVISRRWGAVRRAVVGVIVMGVLLSACSSSSPSEPAADVAKEAVAKKPEKPTEPPDLAEPSKVKTHMNVSHVRSCLYDKPVDISSIAGNYYSPQDLIVGEVENARDLSIDVPEIKMIAAEDFARSIGSRRIKLTRAQNKVNRWLDWNLGYRPFSSRARPGGDGAELVAGFYDLRS